MLTREMSAGQARAGKTTVARERRGGGSAARAALAIANAVACAAFVYMAILSALRGIEAWHDRAAPADAWIAVLFCVVMALSGVAAFLATAGLTRAPAMAMRIGPPACAAAAVAHGVLSVAAVADPDPLTWLLTVITVPAALLLAASWAVLRRR